MDIDWVKGWILPFRNDAYHLERMDTIVGKSTGSKRMQSQDFPRHVAWFISLDSHLFAQTGSKHFGRPEICILEHPGTLSPSR